jgi:hypothetical protein
MAIAENVPLRASRSSFGELLIELVYGLVLVTTVGGWTIAGFLVWVPLLIRTTTHLVAVVFYETLFRDRARVTRAEQHLHFAVRFYLRGFEHFINFYRDRHAPEPPTGLLEPLSEMKWRELLVECIWVIGAWAVLYFGGHFLFSSLQLLL